MLPNWYNSYHNSVHLLHDRRNEAEQDRMAKLVRKPSHLPQRLLFHLNRLKHLPTRFKKGRQTARVHRPSYS
ncbi:MAG: hypothetical protein CL610_19530 [Anaerolineaceae bacterium]|nr:hypothetical protein [Anaerolineaceae bacterium]